MGPGILYRYLSVQLMLTTLRLSLLHYTPFTEDRRTEEEQVPSITNPAVTGLKVLLVVDLPVVF